MSSARDVLGDAHPCRLIRHHLCRNKDVAEELLRVRAWFAIRRRSVATERDAGHDHATSRLPGLDGSAGREDGAVTARGPHLAHDECAGIEAESTDVVDRLA